MIDNNELIEESPPHEDEENPDGSLEAELNTVQESVAQTLEAVDDLEGVTILNADAMILKAAQRGFERRKAIFQSACNGEEALAVFEALPTGSIVLLDNDMGEGMKGVDAAREMKRKRPDIFIILTSGNPDSELIKELIAEKVLDGSFPKPYAVSDLVDYIVKQRNR